VSCSGWGRAVATPLKFQTTPNARNPEIAQLLEAIAKALDAVEQLEGSARDVAFELLKAYAVQYALALFCEGRSSGLVHRPTAARITHRHRRSSHFGCARNRPGFLNAMASDCCN